MFSVKLFCIFALFSFFNIWVSVDASSEDDESTGNDLANLAKDVQSHRNFHLLTSPADCLPMKSISTRIMGGTNARLGEFPWMAYLTIEFLNSSNIPQFAQCDGSIISSKYVLTAAHCLQPENPNDTLFNLTVRVGEYDLDKEKDCDGSKCSYATKYAAERYIKHHNYFSNKTNSINDIGLIRVKGEIIFSEFVYPACLPTSFSMMDENLEGKYATVAGWGMVLEVPNKEVNDPILQTVELEVLEQSFCNLLDDNLVSESKLCVMSSESGKLMKSVCHGDSGGPLMYPSRLNGQDHFVQIGIASFIKGKCNPNTQMQPLNVFTKVTSYLIWILDNINE